LLDDTSVARLVRIATLHAPHTVVDLKDFWRNAFVPILQQSMKILVVTRLDFPGVSNANRALEYLDHVGIERERVKIVVSRAGQPKELPATDVACALKMPINHCIPDDRKTMNSCTNCGTPAVLVAPQAKCVRALVKLADDIDGQAESSAQKALKSTLLDRATPFLGRLVRATNVGIESLVARPST
jgi:Flp pilus assembly CpaE family ATPase